MTAKVKTVIDTLNQDYEDNAVDRTPKGHTRNELEITRTIDIAGKYFFINLAKLLQIGILQLYQYDFLSEIGLLLPYIIYKNSKKLYLYLNQCFSSWIWIRYIVR